MALTRRSTSWGSPATASASKSRLSRSRSKSSRKRPRRRRSSKKELPRRSNSRSVFSTSERRKRKSPDEVGRLLDEARLDRHEGREVVLEYGEACPHELARLRKRPACHARRVLELEAEPLPSSSAAVTRASNAGRPLRRRAASSPRSRARSASRAERAKTSGSRPRVLPACSRTNSTTVSTSRLVRSRSALLRTSTTFLPHCRIASRKARSLSA